MDLGISLLVYNFMRTALEPGPAALTGRGIPSPGESAARA
jgi:hypothetical protein